MFRYREIVGLPVLSLPSGQAIGTVAGLMADPKGRQIRWLSLNSGGRYEGRHWVCIDDVTAMSHEAVTINTENSIRAPEEASEAEHLVHAGGRLIGWSVITDKGQNLGSVSDYEFVPDVYVLIRLLISAQTGLFGNALAIDARHIATVAEDKIVVTENASARQDRRVVRAKEGARKSSFAWGPLSALRRYIPRHSS